MANGGIVGPANIPTATVASGVWRLEEEYAAKKLNTWPLPGLPVTTNLYAWYDTASFSGSTWSDKTANARNATVTAGSVSVVSSAGVNGASMTFNTLQGTTGTRILWPASVLPTTYTLFHVTRYNGTTARIVTSATATNWLSGHWGGYSGVAYHSNWLTQSSSSVHGSNWVASTDQNALYRSNGVSRTTGSPGTPSHTQLIINGTTFAELSDFQIAEVIVYDRTLNSTEISQIESYLSTRYGLGF
jgi:hypothetical protein